MQKLWHKLRSAWQEPPRPLITKMYPDNWTLLPDVTTEEIGESIRAQIEHNKKTRDELVDKMRREKSGSDT